MRIKHVFTAFLAVFLLISGNLLFADDSAGKPLSYEECVALALLNSHEYKIQSEKLNRAVLATLKAAGSLLPEIGIKHSWDYGYDGSNISNNGWVSSITATQPVFHGFSGLMQVFMYEREEAAEQQALFDVKRKITEVIADAFFALASAQADLVNISDTLELFRGRVKDLKSWAAIGKSRMSDVYTAESKASLFSAQLEGAKAGAAAKADALALAMGTEYAAIQQPVETGPYNTALDVNALAEKRPDIMAIKAGLEAQDRRVAAGAGAFLPQVDLTLSKPVGGTPYFGSTVLDTHNWQIMLTANWPLFEGGARIFDSLSALSEGEAQKQKLQDALAKAKYEIKSRLRDYEASENSVKALKDAYEKANKSFVLIQKDYSVGMATNIEVIQSMTDMINVKIALDDEVIAREKYKVLLEILK